jgi:hypothetical protein
MSALNFVFYHDYCYPFKELRYMCYKSIITFILCDCNRIFIKRFCKMTT